MSQSDPKAEAPLAGVRVLDLAEGSLAAVARILGELGADVVRVERPGGVGGEISLGCAAANLGKRAVILDLASAAGREAVGQLASVADILIETTAPGSAEQQALDIAALRARVPGLVILSMPDFGAGSLGGWQASDAVLHALSGELSRSGVPGREPVLPPGEIALQCAAAQGAYAALLGYLQRLQTGDGDHIELSALEAVNQALDPGYGIAGSATSGVPASQLPRGRPDVRHMYPIIRCKDGFVRLCILAVRQWRGMFEWMGSPAEFADPAFNDTRHRFASPTLLPALAAFFADKTRAEVEAGGQRHHVPAAGLLTLDEALETEQIRVRHAIAEVEIAPGLVCTLPNGVVEIDGARAGIKGPPPLAGTPLDAVLADWSRPRAEARASEAAGVPGRPLAGLRVLDMGVIVVGAEQGRLLADYGAEVIKVENAAFPDGSRVGGPTGMAVTFAAGHRNKLGLGLNLREPEGRELFLRLVEQSDVLLSNFKPGTLDSLGFGREALLARNPRLVMADSSAFGSTGPWSGRLGYGPLVRASAGLTAQWRDPEDPEGFCDAMTVYPDHVAARIGVVGVLALLIRRARTGQGGAVSVSQTEVMLSHMARQIARRSLAGRAAEPVRDAPDGIFPCAGEDEWCVVSVRGDADWRALCGALGRPELAQAEGFATASDRAARRDEIDALVRAWTSQRAPMEAGETLQAAGVAAAPMLRVSELPDFPYFRERGVFQTLEQAHVEHPIVVDNRPMGSARLAVPPLASAPLMGEHSRRIARDLLGLSDSEIDRLLAEKVLEAPQ